MADSQERQEPQRTKVTDEEKERALQVIVEALDERGFRLEGWREAYFQCTYNGCQNAEGQPFTARAYHRMDITKEGGEPRKTPALWCHQDEEGNIKFDCAFHKVKIFYEHGIICVPLFRVLEELETRRDPVRRHVAQVMGSEQKCSICGKKSQVREQLMVSPKALRLLACMKQAKGLRDLVNTMDRVLNARAVEIKLDFGRFNIPSAICTSCVDTWIKKPAANILPLDQETGRPRLEVGGSKMNLVVEPEYVLTSIFRKIEGGRRDQQRGARRQ